MPIFFILSGLVLNDNKWLGKENFQRFVISRCKSLLVPYIVWCFIFTIPRIVYSVICGGEILPIVWQEIDNIFIHTGFGKNGFIQWFLLALFEAELLYVAIVNMSKKMSVVRLIISSLFIVVLIFKENGVIFPLSLSSSLLALPFFCFGHQSKKIILYSEEKRIFTFVVMLLLLIISVIVYIYAPFRVNVRTVSFSPWYSCFVSLILSILIIYGVKGFCNFFNYHVSPKGILSYLGQNTIAVLLWNHCVISIIIVSFQLNKVVYSSMIMFFLQLALTLTVVGIILIINKFVIKVFPEALGKNKARKSYK